MCSFQKSDSVSFVYLCQLRGTEPRKTANSAVIGKRIQATQVKLRANDLPELMSGSAPLLDFYRTHLRTQKDNWSRSVTTAMITRRRMATFSYWKPRT